MKLSPPTRPQKSAVPPPRARTTHWLSPLTFSIAVAVIIAGIFAAYSPTLNYQFILDDHRFVNDPRVQSAGHIWDYFTNYVWAQFTGGPPSFYRPVFVLWMRLNFVLSEVSPWGWHLLSIAKHLLVAVLLVLLVWKLLRDRVAALLAGTLFALHPAQTESVAWVTVPDPLMSAAMLGSVLLYLRYADGAGGNVPSAAKSGTKSRKANRAVTEVPSPVGWLIASAFLCLMALFVKETAVVLLPVLFALALILPAQKSSTEHLSASTDLGRQLLIAFRHTLPFWCVTVIYFFLRFNALGRMLGVPTQNLPVRTVVLSAPAILWFYIKVLFWPIRIYAFADPIEISRFSVRGVLLPALGFCCILALLAGASTWALRKARRDLFKAEALGVERALAIGWLTLIPPIILSLNLNALNPGDFLHGRYTYLPLVGLMLLLTTVWHLIDKFEIPLLFVAGLLAIVLAVFTLKQESIWKDDLTVFTVAHEIAPHNAPVALNLARAHVQAAIALGDAGHCDEAVSTFNQVIREYPQDWFAWAGLAQCQLELNDLPKAEQSLRQAVELSHDPRMTQEWQELRAQMGLSTSAPK